jgi:hypothetical protein
MTLNWIAQRLKMPPGQGCITSGNKFCVNTTPRCIDCLEHFHKCCSVRKRSFWLLALFRLGHRPQRACSLAKTSPKDQKSSLRIATSFLSMLKYLICAHVSDPCLTGLFRVDGKDRLKSSMHRGVRTPLLIPCRDVRDWFPSRSRCRVDRIRRVSGIRLCIRRCQKIRRDFQW